MSLLTIVLKKAGISTLNFNQLAYFRVVQILINVLNLQHYRDIEEGTSDMHRLCLHWFLFRVVIGKGSYLFW